MFYYIKKTITNKNGKSCVNNNKKKKQKKKQKINLKK